MELRKHYTQMTQAEQTSLMLAVRIGSFVTTPYSEGRLAQRTLAPTTIQALQAYGKVIEAHKVGEDLRVLLRGKVKGQGACAVFSLTKGLIITAYKNDGNDHHATLDKTIYNWIGEIK